MKPILAALTLILLATPALAMTPDEVDKARRGMAAVEGDRENNPFVKLIEAIEELDEVEIYAEY